MSEKIESNELNKGKVVGGLFWTFGERICAQLVSMIVTIVLARILDPEHYGVISIVTVFITFLNVFVTGGFGSALVQKKEANEIDFNTAFVISITLAFVLFFLLFFTAPLISNFYETDLLTPVLRVMGIRLVIAAINNIQQAYIRRKMVFKKFFFATLIGTIVSGILGVILALQGFGVWALVTQYLSNVAIDTIMLFALGGWKPRFQFSKKAAREILPFGSRVLATELVYTIEGDIRSLIVGKAFGSTELAYYDQGKRYPALVVTNINASIEKVMLPTFSKNQDKLDLLRSTLRRSIKMGVYILSPMLVGFAVISNNFVTVILTDKWIACVPYMQLLAIAFLPRPLGSSCHQSLLAIGKSGTVFVCMLIINLLMLSSVIVAVFVLKSVLWIAIFALIAEFVSLVVFLLFTNKYLKYNISEQIKDILPSLSIAVLMGLGVWFIGYVPLNDAAVLLIQVITGVLIYLGLSFVFNIEPFQYLVSMIKNLKNRGANNG